MNASNFESTVQGKPVRLFHISSNNISCFITNYGARVVSLSTMDKDSRMVDIVLGFDSLDGYLNANEKYHGATVGRYANRIANGQFKIDETTYTLSQNNEPNSLHGGIDAFHNKVWKCISHDDNQLVLEVFSSDMEEGFPGDIKTQVKYKIEGSTIKISYEAFTSKNTVINLTHHSYFNLNGEGSGSILNHSLILNSEYFTPVNENTIPTGSIDMVADTPFDFTQKKKIGEEIDSGDNQLLICNGYDHNFVLNQYQEGELNLVASVFGDKSKIKMDVWSTEPGVQFYSANHLDGSDIGKSGKKYSMRMAFCLETQHFPDSPNQGHFPSTLLKEGEVFKSVTEYRFTII